MTSISPLFSMYTTQELHDKVRDLRQKERIDRMDKLIEFAQNAKKQMQENPSCRITENSFTYKETLRPFADFIDSELRKGETGLMGKSSCFDIEEHRKRNYESRREMDKDIVSYWYPEFQRQFICSSILTQFATSKMEVFPDDFCAMKKVVETFFKHRVAKMSDEYKEYIGLKT